jgi:hypothetical protein
MLEIVLRTPGAGAGGSRYRHAAAGAPGPADNMLALPASVRVFLAPEGWCKSMVLSASPGRASGCKGLPARTTLIATGDEEAT